MNKLLLSALGAKTQLAANQFLVKTLVTGDDSEKVGALAHSSDTNHCTGC